MTTRKPARLSVPDWIEHQIRAAEAEGAFANLPGAGKPIPGIDRPQPELAWVADYLRRENVDASELLPPALAIAKEVERLRDRLMRETSEIAVRAAIGELNDRISAAHARPQIGPVFRVKLVKVEPAVEQWHADRAALDELRRREREAAGAPPPRPVPRRRFRRRPG
jgi:hypothetical protein